MKRTFRDQGSESIGAVIDRSMSGQIAEIPGVAACSHDDGLMKAKSKRTKRAPESTSRTKADWTQPFLAAFAIAANITESCIAAGICRNTFYKRRREDSEFLKACRQAIAVGADSLEREMWRRGKDGWEEPVLYKGELCGVWVMPNGDVVAKGTRGARLIPLTVRKYSNTVGMSLLRAHKPRKYRENFKHARKDGGSVKNAPAESVDVFARVLEYRRAIQQIDACEANIDGSGI